MRNLLLAGIITLFFCSLGNAQTIYSKTFSGGAVNINQKAPTVATDNAGGASSVNWRDAGSANMLYANGIVNTTPGDSVRLPFTPEDGYVYTLTASVTFSGNPGSWIGAGFAQYYAVPCTGNAQFNQSGINGYDWAILTESTGSVQYFAGPSTTGPIFNKNSAFTAGPGTHTLTLTLDTTAAQWVIACYVDGVQAGTSYTYTAQPTIGAVGITQHTLTTAGEVQWNSLKLQATGTRSTNTVNATVSFSGTGLPLNPSFVGLSYEKAQMNDTGFFSSTNTPLINLFSMIGPAVLRIGGGTVDLTGWNGISSTTPITPAEVDSLAGFMNALPPNRSVIHGFNLEVNTPANAAEAAYAAGDLKSSLLGFEVGSEPELYG
jgi:hypothetical protein